MGKLSTNNLNATLMKNNASLRLPNLKLRNPKKISNGKEILQQNAKGVIVFVDGEFKVYSNKELYYIHPKNNSCKGFSIIYSKKVDPKLGRTKYVRDDTQRLFENSNYLPYREKLEVSGDISYVGTKKCFNINKYGDLITTEYYINILKEL